MIDQRRDEFRSNDMLKYELKEGFQQHYSTEYLDYLEQKIPGITDRLWVAYCNGYMDGVIHEELKGANHGSKN